MSALRVLLLLSLLGAGRAWADLIVIQDVEAAGARNEITIQIKGQKVRTDLADPVTILFDAASGETIYLQRNRKTFSRVTAEQGKALAEKMRQSAPPGTAGKLEATAQKKEISGCQTELYLWTIAGLKMRFWVAKSFPGGDIAQSLLDQMQSSGLGQATAGLMPPRGQLPGLRVRTELETAGQKLSYTITSIKQLAIPASAFEIPKGYKETPFDVTGEDKPEP